MCMWLWKSVVRVTFCLHSITLSTGSQWSCVLFSRVWICLWGGRTVHPSLPPPHRLQPAAPPPTPPPLPCPPVLRILSSSPTPTRTTTTSTGSTTCPHGTSPRTAWLVGETVTGTKTGAGAHPWVRRAHHASLTALRAGTELGMRCGSGLMTTPVASLTPACWTETEEEGTRKSLMWFLPRTRQGHLMNTATPASSLCTSLPPSGSLLPRKNSR